MITATAGSAVAAGVCFVIGVGLVAFGAAAAAWIAEHYSAPPPPPEPPHHYGHTRVGIDHDERRRRP